MLREVLMVEAWLEKFQRGAKTLSERFMPYFFNHKLIGPIAQASY